MESASFIPRLVIPVGDPAGIGPEVLGRLCLRESDLRDSGFCAASGLRAKGRWRQAKSDRTAALQAPQSQAEQDEDIGA